MQVGMVICLTKTLHNEILCWETIYNKAHLRCFFLYELKPCNFIYSAVQVHGKLHTESKNIQELKQK